jgi:hypothetical protein
MTDLDKATQDTAGYEGYKAAQQVINCTQLNVGTLTSIGLSVGLPTPAVNITGPPGNYAMAFFGALTAGSSYGLLIRAGSTAADFGLIIQDYIAAQTFLQIFGDGHGFLGPSSFDTLAWTAAGQFTFSARVSTKGGIPGVTAGQTDIGISTTATVITTAGGIALPALAKTFWVVNVNGVAYGVPLFAL